MNASKSTPMIKQYLAIKKNYPDAILFFRMGDFYEMFFEDAKIASQILEITLTSRNKNENIPIPMCGVPVRAVQTYVARMLDSGKKVAICDQVEDPAMAKGIVKREVVRVITPGMIIENEFLDEKTNNFILAVAAKNGIFGLSYLDISTGAFRLTESDDMGAVTDEALRVSPGEILLPSSFREDAFFDSLVSACSDKPITYFENFYFDADQGRELLLEQFKTLSLEGFGCETKKAGISAAGALIQYIRETQKQTLAHLNHIETYTLDNYLLADELTCRNLELMKNLRNGGKNGTLLSVIDQTATAMGGRLLKRWLRYPITAEDEINARLDAVEEARKYIQQTRDIREALKSVYDLERLGSKVSMGHCNARDLIALKRSFEYLPKIFQTLTGFLSALFRWDGDIEDLTGLRELIEQSIREDAPPTIGEGGMIKEGYNEKLDELIQIGKDGKGFLARLEAKEKKALGINALKVRYNKVFGYYIEIPKAHSESVPSHYIRKQTLVNAERYITDELKSAEDKILGAEDRRAVLEYEIFEDVKSEIIRHNSRIQSVAAFVANLDCLLNLAEIADQNDYIRPEMNSSGQIVIEDGRHPVVEKMIIGERFVPNSISLDNINNQVLIITGPNMAGKSTILRQVALIVLMAHMGSFVPAKKATISITDRIFTRVGALDNLSHGQSTFMVEMQETANILNHATAKSLVIMDEIGRGTSTFDGLSIAWAVAEYLHDLKHHGVKTLFATHYHELTEMNLPRMHNYNVAVKEYKDDIIFLRKLVEGGTNRSYGIHVARLAGVPQTVIDRARTILREIERSGEAQNAEVLNLCEAKSKYRKEHVQMTLFPGPESAVIDEIRNVDISNMTPLEALNFLNDLQQMTNGLMEKSNC